MIRNYFSIAYRSLLKNRVFSMVNIAGLAIGMTAFMLIMEYVRFERSYENFHEHADRIYRLTLDIYKGNEYEVTDCETHAGIAPLLKEKSPRVTDFVRMYHKDGIANMKVNGKSFLHEGIYFADSSVFNVFSLSLITGDPQHALTDPFQAVIAESLARDYFGSSDVVGKTIEIDQKDYQVTAVMRDLPPNTHLKYTILLSHETISKIRTQYDDWSGNNEYTYLLMAPGSEVAEFNEELKTVSTLLKEKIGDGIYTAQPIRDIHLHSNKSYEPEANGNVTVVYTMLIIAILIIIIAWVNYVNLSTARAVERAREVGIRKVMGSMRSQLVWQFLSESVVVNILAGTLAFVFFQTALPLFRELAGQPVSWEVANTAFFWTLFALVVGIGSLLSGVYPALVLSSFQPAQVLKGKFRSSAHGQRLRQALVVIQFSATVVLIIGMSAIYSQIQHMRDQNLGVNINQTLVIRAPQLENDSIAKLGLRAFRTEMQRLPEVKNIAVSECLPGLSIHDLSTTSLARAGDDRNDLTIYFFSADADFIPTLEMQFAAGRNFEHGASRFAQVIINEEAARRLGFSSAEQAVGSKVNFVGSGIEPPVVIGVLKNFHQRSPKEEHLPMLLLYTEEAEYFATRIVSTNIGQSLASIRETWDRVFPNTIFSYYFLDEKFNQQYDADAKFGQVIATFSGLAIFIACLGLFGLSSYTIVQRTKEIGIRKVLGASVTHIVELLSLDFMKVVLLASLIALPIAYLAVENWLDEYSVRVSLSVWLFLWPVLIVLLVTLITVSVQTIKTALANPTNALRQD